MSPAPLTPWGEVTKRHENDWFAAVDEGIADTHVYRYFDETRRLLYVGQTTNPKARDAAHRNRASWFPLVATRELRGPMTKARALFEEFLAIALENPTYNLHARNGHTGPGSDRWAQRMSDLFQVEARANSAVYRAEMEWAAQRMNEFFRQAGLHELVARES